MCKLCITETKSDSLVCSSCQKLIDLTKEYSRTVRSCKNCPICHKSTSNKFLAAHGLCSSCYKLSGGKPNTPPSPTGKEFVRYLTNRIDIYEKIEQPRRFILQDLTRLYFNIMSSNELSMVKKLETLNLAIDEYLIDAIKELN